MLLKGMIQGGSVGSKDVTLADVRQDASIEAETVQLKELNNAGTVKVTELARQPRLKIQAPSRPETLFWLKTTASLTNRPVQSRPISWFSTAENLSMPVETPRILL
ncbi:MAG: hypothetical protein ACLSE8_09290 [Parasutterella sp.]